jgi:hypothetical protein
MSRVMLTEDQVNVAVKAFLEARGWRNVVALDGRRHGIDVEGEHPTTSLKVQVESKGGTSGDPSTNRHGKACTSTQIRSHVARAVFTALTLRACSETNTILVALPDDEAHLEVLGRVECILKTLAIGLLAVSRTGVRVVFGSVLPEPHSEPTGSTKGALAHLCSRW